MRASCPLGFRDEVRLEVENSISREGGPLPDCFDVPAKLIWRLLEEVKKINQSNSNTPVKMHLKWKVFQRYLPKYLESDGFNRYLTELRSAIKNHIELPPVSGIARRKTTAGENPRFFM